jgi:hypothetical protein
VKVDGTGNGVFDVGGYKLAVDFLSVGGVLAPLTNTVAAVLDLHTNDGLLSALSLAPPKAADARFDAIYRGVIEDHWDVDTYKVNTNKFAAGTAVTLNVMVWGLDEDQIDPRVRVYDAAGKPVAFQVLSNDDGLFTLQATNAVAGSYYVQVAARAPGGANDTGSYFLAVNYNRSAPTVYDGVASGAVQTGVTQTGSLALPDSGLFQFALAADSAAPGGVVTMTVYDENGAVVFTLTAVAGQPTVTTVQYLKAGNYTVRYSSPAATPTNYNLFLLILSDEVGTYSTTTASPPPDGGSSQSTSGSTTTSTSSGGSSYTYSGSSTTKPTGYGYTY